MKTDIIVDMQLGSSGKGKFAQYLAKKNKYSLYIKGGGTNAGHTIYLGDAKVKLQTIPVGSFVDKNALLLLDASTTTTLDILKKECELAEYLGFSVRNRLFLDFGVGLVDNNHIKEEETLINKIGSVGTGTGPARISRLKRDGSLKTAGNLVANEENTDFLKFVDDYEVTIIEGYRLVASSDNSLIEGYQATHLDVLHSSFYPFCTSWGTTASALAWNAGVAPKDVRDVYGVFCPILTRPGNFSGGTYSDSKQLTWKEIKDNCGSKIDLTEIAATSGRERRVFSFSSNMFEDSQILNRPNKYALMRADYIDDKLKEGKLTDKTEDWIKDNISHLGVDHILGNLVYISTGPKEKDYIIPDGVR